MHGYGQDKENRAKDMDVSLNFAYVRITKLHVFLK